MEKWNEYNKRTLGAGHFLLEQLICAHDIYAICLQDSFNHIEVYIDPEVVNQLSRQFENEVANFSTDVHLSVDDVNPVYPVDVMHSAKQRLSMMRGFTADKEFSDEVLKLVRNYIKYDIVTLANKFNSYLEKIANELSMTPDELYTEFLIGYNGDTEDIKALYDALVLWNARRRIPNIKE